MTVFMVSKFNDKIFQLLMVESESDLANNKHILFNFQLLQPSSKFFTYFKAFLNK